MAIEYIARAVIRRDGGVLLCRHPSALHWFFPGGHIEDGESAHRALLRELDEELGVNGEVTRFLGASENTFTDEGGVHQELNLVFEVSLSRGETITSKEDHLEFAWFSEAELGKTEVYPTSLRDAIISGAVPLWTSEGFYFV